jgi:hypothetical protein
MVQVYVAAPHGMLPYHSCLSTLLSTLLTALLAEAALQRQKDSKGSAKPLNRREAFQAVWRDRRLGSDADAALAEKRFRMHRLRALN